MLQRLTVAVLGALLLACGDEHEPRLSVATQGSVFDRGGAGTIPEAAVPFTVTNRGDFTAFIPVCGDRPAVAVERGTGNRWEQYAGDFCIFSSIQPPVELRAGESVTGEYRFHEAGHYRIRLTYGADADGEHTWGFDAASNSFDVR